LKTELFQATYVTPSFNPERAGDLRGHIDEFDLRKAVRGWAISLSSPTEPLTLEILVGKEVVAQCETGILRKDIAEIVRAEARAGFQFSNDAIQALWEQLPAAGDEPITIRFAGTSLLLPSRAPLPTLAEAFSLTEPSQDQAETPSSKFGALLSQVRRQTSKPLRPFPYQQVGYIESISFEEPGWVWVAGWMRRTKNFESAATIIEGSKNWPAAVALTLYEREDLNAEACAFLAVLRTDWVPRLNSDMSLVFSHDLSSRISFVPVPRIKTVDEFFQLFLTMKNRFFAGKTEDIYELIREWQSWRPSRVELNVQALRPTIEAAVEHVLVLPGFGCLVTGWAVSLMKTIEGFGLKLGSAVMACDQRTLTFKARPDLIKVFSGHEKAIDNAGFTGVFRGNVSADNMINPVLKVVFTDGSSFNVAIDLKLLRQLGKTTQLDAACELYPALTSEIFFPEFADAVRRQSSSGKHVLRPYLLTPASKTIVFVAPDHKGELFLLFEELIQFARHLPSSVGLTIIAPDSQHDLISILFDSFRKDSAPSASLFFTDDTLDAFYTLPEILERLDASNFAFVGSNVFLTSEGWQAVCRYLTDASDTLHFFEVMDPAITQNDRGSHSAQCFGWTANALALHLATAPYHFGALVDERPLPCDQVSERSPGCAWFSRLPIMTPLSLAINSLVEKA